MDQTLSDDYIRHVLARFVSAVHGDSTRRMIWIGPPDSSRFSKVQNRIYRLIQQSVPRADPVVDSRRFTRYVLGKTGGDGIHYNRESGEAWAKPVNASIDQILAAEIAASRKLASNPEPRSETQIKRDFQLARGEFRERHCHGHHRQPAKNL